MGFVHNFNNTVEPDSEFLFLTMSWLDYLIICSVVGVSLGFGLLGRNGVTTESYFWGNRHVNSITITLSLLCSFLSGVTLVHFPQEIYLYGSQCSLLIISLIPATITLAHFYLPVYFNLQLGSAFEYFEIRFSRGVRIFTSFAGIISSVGCIALIVFGTSTVLSEVLGLSTCILAMALILACILSSTLGGFTSILWSGSSQALIMTLSLLILIGLGEFTSANFTIGDLWKRAVVSGRIEFLNLDVDPRVRHTFWTSVIGGYFLWLSLLGGTQGQIQRLIASSHLARAKRTLVLYVCLTILILLLVFIATLLMFTHSSNCASFPDLEVNDKSGNDFVNKVVNTMKYFPGGPGLFTAGILAASLSCISNALNSLALTATMDYFKHWIPNISEDSLVFLARALTVAFGCLAFGMVFVVESLEVLISEAWCLFTILVAAIFGTFTLGMFFPWANSKGAMLGFLGSVSVMAYAVFLRSKLESYRNFPDQRINFFSTNCSEPAHATYPNFLTQEYDNPYIPKLYSSASSDWKDQSSGEALLIKILSISPMWYPELSWLLCLTFGLFFSLLFLRWEKNWRVRPECMSPPMLKFWFKCFPTHMRKWMEPDDNLFLLCSSSFSAMPIASESYGFHKGPLCDVKFNPA